MLLVVTNNDANTTICVYFFDIMLAIYLFGKYVLSNTNHKQRMLLRYKRVIINDYMISFHVYNIFILYLNIRNQKYRVSLWLLSIMFVS